jgi:hypothetical protein
MQEAGKQIECTCSAPRLHCCTDFGMESLSLQGASACKILKMCSLKGTTQHLLKLLAVQRCNDSRVSEKANRLDGRIWSRLSTSRSREIVAFVFRFQKRRFWMRDPEKS